MATVTGLTAARMQELFAASITDARVNDKGELIFTTEGGQDTNVGSIRGPKGDQGPGGAVSKVAGVASDSNGNVPLKPSDIGAAAASDLSALLPSGMILPMARSAAPSGFLMCQGQEVSRTTYANLFAAINTSYGAGDGTTTFNVPDLQGRVPVGKDVAQTEFDTLGETGGEKAHKLTADEMPTHNHRVYRNSVNNVQQAVPTSAGDASSGNRFTLADGTENLKTLAAGGDKAHNNLQPYQVINYAIKT